VTELNGWRRLWIVVACVWGAAVIAGTGAVLYDRAYTFDGTQQVNVCHGNDEELKAAVEKRLATGESEDNLATFIRQYDHPSPLRRLSACYPKASVISGGLASWFIPVALTYLFGAAVAWVRGGFRTSKQP
jgi:hypothetical protein